MTSVLNNKIENISPGTTVHNNERTNSKPLENVYRRSTWRCHWRFHTMTNSVMGGFSVELNKTYCSRIK